MWIWDQYLRCKKESHFEENETCSWMTFPPAAFLWLQKSEYHRRNNLFYRVTICQKQAGGTINCKARSEQFCFQFLWFTDNMFSFVKGKREGNFLQKLKKKKASKKQQYFCEGELSDIKQNDPFILLFEDTIRLYPPQIKGLCCKKILRSLTSRGLHFSSVQVVDNITLFL